MDFKSNTTDYKNAFRKEKYDQFAITVPKGEKEAIKNAAKAAGMSVNKFVYEAIREKIEREKNE